MSAVLVAAEANKGRGGADAGRNSLQICREFRWERHQGPLGLVQMPPVEVQTEGQLGQRVSTSRGLALPLGEARLDARFEAGEIAVAAVDDAPLVVHQDGLEQPVFLDVGDQLLEHLAVEQWKQVCDGVKL